MEPRRVCFRCGYDVLGAADAAQPDRCPECGVEAPLSGHPVLPWPRWHVLAWQLAAVAVYAGAAFGVLRMIGAIARRSGWLQLATLVGWSQIAAAALGLSFVFVYAVSIPDDLLDRHMPRGRIGRNRTYLLLLAASGLANAVVIIVTVVAIVTLTFVAQQLGI